MGKSAIQIGIILTLLSCAKSTNQSDIRRDDNPTQDGPPNKRTLSPPDTSQGNAAVPTPQLVAYAFSNLGYEGERTLPAVVAKGINFQWHDSDPSGTRIKIEAQVRTKNGGWTQAKTLPIGYSGLQEALDIYLVPAEACEMRWRFVDYAVYAAGASDYTIENGPWSEVATFEKAYPFEHAASLVIDQEEPTRVPSTAIEYAGVTDWNIIMMSLPYMNKYDVKHPKYITHGRMYDALRKLGYQDGGAITEEMAARMPEALGITREDFLDRLSPTVWSIADAFKKLFSQ